MVINGRWVFLLFSGWSWPPATAYLESCFGLTDMQCYIHIAHRVGFGLFLECRTWKGARREPRSCWQACCLPPLHSHTFCPQWLRICIPCTKSLAVSDSISEWFTELYSGLVRRKLIAWFMGEMSQLLHTIGLRPLPSEMWNALCTSQISARYFFLSLCKETLLD